MCEGPYLLQVPTVCKHERNDSHCVRKCDRGISLPLQREPRTRAPGLERHRRDHSGHGGDITPKQCPQLGCAPAGAGCAPCCAAECKHSPVWLPENSHTPPKWTRVISCIKSIYDVHFVKLGKSLPCKIVYLYHQYYFCYLNSRYSSSCFCTWICNWMD